MGPTTVAAPLATSTRRSTLLALASLPPAPVDEMPYITLPTATRSPDDDSPLPKLPRSVVAPVEVLICFTVPAPSAASRLPLGRNVRPLLPEPDRLATKVVWALVLSTLYS